MANETNKSSFSPFDKNPTVFTKGMFKDTNEEFQPEGTYRFALNAVLSSKMGEKGALITEEGNVACANLEDNSAHVIGNCLLDNGKVVLFISYDAYGIYPAHGAIAIQNEDCTIEFIVRSECLDFQREDVINCEYKIQSGCDTILYFTDRRTKYKYVNISKLEQYVKPGFTLENANTPVMGSFGWDCGLFNFNPDYNIPEIYLEQVSTGGRLRIGSYYIAFRYLDQSLNPTNWTPSYGAINITYPPNESNPYDISGGILNTNSLVDGFYYTNKSIKLLLKNLDTRYKYYQIAVLEFTQGTATNNLTFISRSYSIDNFSGEATFIITELSPNQGFVSTSPQNINIPSEYIDVVRAHVQVDRRLLVGNLANNVFDWSKFQKAANEVKTLYYTYDKLANLDNGFCPSEIISSESLEGESIVPGREFNRPEFLYDHKTYMRDEVYALAIVYVFKNGKESPAFHIPGRPAIVDAANAGTTLDGKYSVEEYPTPFETFDNLVGRARWYLSTTDLDHFTSSTANGFYDNYNSPIGGNWDRELYTYDEDKLKPQLDLTTYDGLNSNADSNVIGSYTMANTLVDKSQNILSTTLCDSNDNVERWQFVNTAIKFNTENSSDPFDSSFSAFTNLQALTADRLYSAGLCAYYETDTQYPDIRDCDGNLIFPHTILDEETGEYVMHRIRHHRMPDARHELLFDAYAGTSETPTEVSLKPLGLFFYDIAIPEGYEDQLQGFYIVRSDRSGNKTVIDKGWLNVNDVTFALNYDAGDAEWYTTNLNNNAGTGTDFTLPFVIQQNPIWMCPTDKYGSVEPNRFLLPDEDCNGRKRMNFSGANCIEYFSPKSSFNEPVNLQGSYYKLENTIRADRKELLLSNKDGKLGDIPQMGGRFNDPDWTNDETCEAPNAWEGYESWRVFGRYVAADVKLPRMFTPESSEDFYLLHNLPILYSEYALYNTDDFSNNGFTINNENHRQRIMLSKLYKDYQNVSTALAPWYLNIASIFKPKSYAVGSDWIEPFTLDFPTSPRSINVEKMLERLDTIPTSYLTNRVQFYYAALKSSIIPYRKLEDIVYIKATQQIQSFPEVGLGSCFSTEGDCYISRQFLYKSYQRSVRNNVENNTDTDGKVAGTILEGYVESEINTHFRNKFTGEVYYMIPIDTVEKAIRQNVEDVHEASTTLIDFIEHLYHYRLDYSVDNRNRVFLPLTDNFDYCSKCSERFPNTIRISEPSLSTQVFDNYKLFLANNLQEIPADTGEITNMLLKEQNLFVQTVSNMYRLNVSAQELKTGNDAIQVGSGDILSATPQRLFDNASGYGRGGTEFEHSGAFCNDEYIWVDNKSKRVYSLSKGIEDLSLLGLEYWLRENLHLELRERWKSITGTDYPYLNTSGNRSIGFIGCYDPYYNRYILHKKDYRLTPTLLANLRKDTPDELPYTVGKFYWNETGLYVANTVSSLKEVLLENEILIENNSFTLSYDLINKCWVSFHSYRPNHMFSNNSNFFSTINNESYSNKTWQHSQFNFTKYYTVKHDFIYEYVSKASDPIISRSFESIEVTGNVYSYSTANRYWKEETYKFFDRVHVFNNNQSSGLFNITVKNTLPYFDVQNDFISTRTISALRRRETWRLNTLRDFTKDIFANETVNTKEWSGAYSATFRTNENMGYIDYVPNADFIDVNKDIYQLQRFTDKYLSVRLFFKPNEDYKMVVNTNSNLKKVLF